MNDRAPRSPHHQAPDAHAALAIVGSSPDVLAAIHLAHLAGPTNIPVLIIGETGTGKELVARLFHQRSCRSGPLVAVDCGALPDDLLESLLFGHRRGAFTGAVEHSGGLIAEADQGTLFLDELGSLSMRGQSKLLRVLETGAVRRVGESRSQSVGFRLVATAQPGLWGMLQQGSFRDDLYQRVAGIVICMPPLRERGNDVALLASSFAESEGLHLEDEAADMLARRDWPGNIRELKWMVARCALFATGDTIGAQAVRMAMEIGPAQVSAGAPSAIANGLTQLRVICESHRGDADVIANALGIGRSTLYRRLKHVGLRLRPFRRQATR